MARKNGSGNDSDGGRLIMTTNQTSDLPAEVVRVLQAQPELGINGYHCKHTQSAANFPTDRAAAFQPDFVLDVATVMETLATRGQSVGGHIQSWTGLAMLSSPSDYEWSQLLPGSLPAERVIGLGAAIVACYIAGIPHSRIPGNPDVRISRRRTK